MNTRQEYISNIIQTYNSVVKVVDKDAHKSTSRAYGGIIRAIKGSLVEHIAEELVNAAWSEIKSVKKLTINSKKIKIPLDKSYIDSITNQEVKEYIQKNINKYYYGLSVDKHVFIDSNFVFGIECKAYTENAMIKRIMVDFMLLKKYYPNIHCFLFQLESQLGGDFAELNKITYGSYSTHTIMSYFNFPLNIITFLKGERKVDKPIHKNFKQLDEDKLSEVIDKLITILLHYK